MIRWWLVLLLVPVMVFAFPCCKRGDRERHTEKRREDKRLLSYIQELKSHEYEVIKEVFITRDFQGSIAVYPPGCMSGIPDSLESYLQYGDQWDQDPVYQKKRGCPGGNDEMLAVVPIGTKFRITGIKKIDFGIGCYWRPCVKFELPPFDQLEVSAYFLFENSAADKFQYFKSLEEYAKVVNAPPWGPIELTLCPCVIGDLEGGMGRALQAPELMEGTECLVSLTCLETSLRIQVPAAVGPQGIIWDRDPQRNSHWPMALAARKDLPKGCHVRVMTADHRRGELIFLAQEELCFG